MASASLMYVVCGRTVSGINHFTLFVVVHTACLPTRPTNNIHTPEKSLESIPGAFRDGRLQVRLLLVASLSTVRPTFIATSDLSATLL